MSRKSSFQPADFLPQSSKAAAIEALSRPPMANQFSPLAMALVMSIRLMAACQASRHDPLVELTRRLESLTAAKAVLDFARACSRAWPEHALVNRPCCHALTPDEAVFARMVETARAADRQAFADLLDGLIRRERHGRLFEEAQQVVAALSHG
ncbi:hypothetical protein [Aurantiacibacter poecillastricola]|uniref:hypothetical protein n=1 Tax=Aurantiacibacter poecillastricola TaxID=3064385 RepID=UPI00273DA649|nr:hypothetical protein [Aurantiacibacter sp. 219JJ12-13]MDP5260184.1 hypothetical protein [Aurantiacibacter sp. 219JJ12-13]